MSRARVVCVPLLIALASIVVSGQQRPTFRVGVDLVTVDVSVSRGGHPVSGLALENFVVFDNGVEQKLEGISVEQVPIDAFLVLDTSASLAGNRLSQLKSAADALLDGLTAHDRASLIAFSHVILVRCPLTADLRAVRSELVLAESSGRTALDDAVYVTLRLREPRQNRAVAVVFTDGFDNASWLSEDRVLDAATRSDVIIYGVTLGDPVRLPGVVSGDKPPSYKFLESAASATGGRLFHAATGDKLRDAFERVLEDVRARYLLRYSPDKITPGWHTLEVRLQRARGDITARRGYFAAR